MTGNSSSEFNGSRAYSGRLESRQPLRNLPTNFQVHTTFNFKARKLSSMILRDIAVLAEDDPIKILFRVLQPWPTTFANVTQVHLEAIAARRLQRNNPTANKLTQSARNALFDPGYGMTARDRFFQDLALISLECPFPPSAADLTAMTIWDLGRIAKGTSDSKYDIAMQRQYAQIEELPSLQKPPRRLPDETPNNRGCAKERMIDNGDLGVAKGFNMAPGVLHSQQLTMPRNQLGPLLPWRSETTIHGHIAERIMIDRAACLIMDLFYVYRKRCYHDIFSHIEYRHGLLYLYSLERRTSAKNRDFPLRRFPIDKVPNGNDLNACLVSQECINFCVQMYDLVLIFLRDLCPIMHEYHLYVRNAVRPTLYFDPASRPHNNVLALHTVLRANSRSGRSYCLDFTAAQFGWDDPCSDWTAFATTRLRSVSRVAPFGTECAAARRQAREAGPARVTMEFFCEVAGRFTDVVRGWFQKEGWVVEELLALGERDFETVAGGLLKNVEGEFGRVMEEMERRREYCLVLRDGAVHIEQKSLGRRPTAKGVGLYD
ncbi:hypothetical protein EV356DRAFT_381473 [Viridothelium virens]|uniref:Uncharacterized protein n=1 Tax=Viridothelium virens TaxID=1048519 RepID=A0A6A6HHR2_VIRVR|nr:hypothetical protein EV356DRAFT_381473 [Viridothelium virens]